MSYDNPNPDHPARPKSFEQRFVDAINDAGLMLMCSIGHRTGLFDTMAGMDWATSEEIAVRADLNERYVREWLGAVATGHIVEVDPEDRFRLPPEHAAFLSRDGTNENLAVFAQYVSVLGSVEDDIVDCFREGGGVPYERYGRFHEVMAEDSGLTVLTALEDDILPLVPGLTERLESGIDVLDVGCGRGRALMALAERFPNSSFHGFDLSSEAIAWAEEQVQERGLTNLHLEVRDASDFDRTAIPDSYDLVTTFDAIHDQPRPLGVLKGIAKTLKPDGIYLMQDIHSSSHIHGDMDHPLGPFLYTISCMHCMSVSLAQNGTGLGAMWGRETALEYLEKAGFSDIQVHRLEHDVQNDYFVARPS
jgi:2-polyprenyl-3-methyl-5-hydroxy-6-metoxy-1,4-benzoquinol methylase